MMIDPIISVEYDLPAFMQAIAQLSRADAVRVFHNFRAGLDTLALEYQRQWKAYAKGEPIPGSTRRIHSKGPYANSIKTDLTRDLDKRIYTDYKFAELIEAGHREIDMKETRGPKGGLLHGPKARLTKGRTRAGSLQGMPHAYNIVSFRHGAPRTSANPMPKNIYAEVTRMFRAAKEANMQEFSKVVAQTGGKVVVHPVSGSVRQLPIYSWGQRTGELGERKTKGSGYTWKTGKQSGMVKMRGNSYRTFRTISAKSPTVSWIIPALSGVPIRQAVVDTLNRRKVAARIIADAMIQDLGMSGMQEHKQ